MSCFLIGCALGALIAACIGAPFLAPWPVRVRYLAAAPLVDPWIGLTPAPSMQMRAVTLATVRADHGNLELALDGLDTGCASRSMTLRCTSCSPSVIAGLDGWAVLRTPLLMVIEAGRGVHLYGPDGEVTDLVLTEEKV